MQIPHDPFSLQFYVCRDNLQLNCYRVNYINPPPAPTQSTYKYCLVGQNHPLLAPLIQVYSTNIYFPLGDVQFSFQPEKCAAGGRDSQRTRAAERGWIGLVSVFLVEWSSQAAFSSVMLGDQENSRGQIGMRLQASHEIHLNVDIESMFQFSTHSQNIFKVCINTCLEKGQNQISSKSLRRFIGTFFWIGNL